MAGPAKVRPENRMDHVVSVKRAGVGQIHLPPEHTVAKDKVSDR